MTTAATAEMQQLLDNSRQWNYDLTDVRFARAMDDNDPLRAFRQQFHYPKLSELLSCSGEFQYVARLTSLTSVQKMFLCKFFSAT